MTLASGRMLGPYEIVGPIGAGGMGEVYRARDTRLNRTVAVKLLAAPFAADAEFRARFDREAQAISQLQHPNICTLYDVGHQDGVAYLVLEHLEGETLAARLERAGAFDFPGALTVAIQIAAALESAHRVGIIHRDLKPGNIMLVRSGSGSAAPVAKLLDFGLAKPSSSVAGMAALTAAPTRTTPITAQGAILGTCQYMAPEQLDGHEADARSDIWAFGCVLYECLTGRTAFQGKTQAGLIGAILRDQPPPLSAAAPRTPAPLERIVSTCLAKDPDDRWQSAADLRRELEWIRDAPEMPVTDARRRGPGVIWLAATIGVAAATGLGVWWAGRPAPVRSSILRAELPVRVDLMADDPGFDISPDGRLLAYVPPDEQSLVLRDLGSGEERVLAKGSLIGEPFFSPDSLQVGFVSGAPSTLHTGFWGALARVAVGGGAPVTIVEGIASLKGACWGDDGWIYYSPAPAAGLWRVRAAGGAAETLTTPDASQGEKSHRRPFVLPGSRALLFVVSTSRITSFDDARIEVLTIRDRVRHALIDGGAAPRYLAGARALVYDRGGSLIAIPFDPDRLESHGAPATIVNGVSHEPSSGVSRYSVSVDGRLIWLPAPLAAQSAIVSLDRQGRASHVAAVPLHTPTASLSPDGSRLAIDPDGASQQIQILDLVRNSSERLTYEWDNADPIWTPDGTRLIFLSNRGGGVRNLYWQAADGSTPAERLTTSAENERAYAISGRTIVYESVNPNTHQDLWALSLDDRTPRPLVRTPFNETAARVSPDGRWLAYQSDQSGRFEIYVQPFSPTGRRWTISSEGGTQPMWMPGGREIVFLDGRDVMTAAITSSSGFSAALPSKLLTLQPGDTLLDIARDGHLLVVREPPPVPPPLEIVVNWFDDVRRATAGAGR